VVGPTFYGVKNAMKVPSVTETVTTYNPTVGIAQSKEVNLWNVRYDGPLDIVVLQYKGLLKENRGVRCWDSKGALLKSTQIGAGSTILYLEASTMLNGQYYLEVGEGVDRIVLKVQINR
jgi:hypothetical protein